MTDDLKDIIIKAAATDDEPTLSADEVAALRRAAIEYPASVVAPMLLLKYCDSLLADDERQSLRKRVALHSGDPAAVITMIDPAANGFATFYPPVTPPAAPSTESTIDTFLEKYGHRSDEEDALLEKLIFNPVPDYAETLARTETPDSDAPAPAAGSQDALIDAFLASNPVETHEQIFEETVPEPPAKPKRRDEPKKTAPTAPDDSLLSESLAKIFIKQGRYERAYEIISTLSLNYPKKSIYFADQLRFLRKLILNQQAGSANNTKNQS